MSFVLTRNNIGPDLYVICSEKAPGTKPVEKPSAAGLPRPLGGAEVLVAVRRPSPGEGGREKLENDFHEHVFIGTN